jgi:hypothetical protein
MAWDALILCVTFIKRLADDLPDENWFTNTMVQAMPHIYAKTRLSVGKLDGESLGQILYISRRLKASKREDKVFALFWALKAVDETFPPPDYSKPVAEIYREATVTVLKNGGSLNLLQECFDYNGSFDRCSWVPDWSSNPWMPFNNANATKKSSRRIRFSADFKKICLHGKMIDQIQLRTSSLPMASRNLDDFTSPIIDRIRHRISFIRAWQHWVQSTSKLSQYESGQDAFAAFWKLLKLFYYSKRGNLEKWPSEEVIPTFINTLLASQSDSSDYLQFIRQQLSSHWTPDFAPYKHLPEIAIYRALESESLCSILFAMKCLVPAFTFFITRTGYMGFAPPLIASDDLIVLFSGLEYPMIVRRAVDDAYRLIGPAWIDGMMEGELWPEDEGSLKEFIIC